MTLLFLVGLAQTFFFNKYWTFSQRSEFGQSLWRYLTVYGIGYLCNLIALAVLVDAMGCPHAIVQGAAILILAVGLFLAQKYWVFADHAVTHPRS